MKETLQKLLEGGWNFKIYFGDCEVYGKGNDRVLYYPKKEDIISKYLFDETESKQNANMGDRE